IAVQLPNSWIWLLYATAAVVVFAFGWQFRPRIRKTPYGLLLAGLGWLAVSSIVTLTSLKQHDPPEVWERGARLLAALNLLGYVWQVCNQGACAAVDDRWR
ncbi:hypothetical protein H6F43_18245, partial [Leptolyngbya sp. FACHB-36]